MSNTNTGFSFGTQEQSTQSNDVSGVPTQASTNEDESSFTIRPTSEVPNNNDSSTPNNTNTGKFSFGTLTSNSVSQVPTISPSFSFGTPQNNSSQTTSATTGLSTGFRLESTTATSNLEVSSSVPTTTPAFSYNHPITSTPSTNYFSFSNIASSLSSTSPTATTTVEPKFGVPKTEIELPSFSFGNSISQQALTTAPAFPSTSNLFSSQTQPTQNTGFGNFGATATAATTASNPFGNPFGASTVPAPSSFSFGSTNPSTTSAPFGTTASFGLGTTTTPSAFGIQQVQTQPTVFGQADGAVPTAQMQAEVAAALPIIQIAANNEIANYFTITRADCLKGFSLEELRLQCVTIPFAVTPMATLDTTSTPFMSSTLLAPTEPQQTNTFANSTVSNSSGFTVKAPVATNTGFGNTSTQTSSSYALLEKKIQELEKEIEQLKKRKEEAVQNYSNLSKTQHHQLWSTLQFLSTLKIPKIPNLEEQYEAVQTEIKRGSMGLVKEYKSKSDSSSIMIKQLELPYFEQDTTSNQIEQELQTMETMIQNSIPPIVPILGYKMDTLHSSVSFVMPKYECSLFDLIHSTESNSFFETMDQKKEWIISAVKCVQFLHKNGITHKNIKSTNFLVKNKQQFQLVISDFSTGNEIYQNLRDANANNSGGIGVTRWMAPEVAQDHSQCSLMSDIYSLAIVIWEILSGKVPFEGVHWISIVLKVKDGVRPEIDESWDEKWAQLLTQCWHENPKERMTCDEILEHIA